MKLLIVDDEETIREGIEKFIKSGEFGFSEIRASGSAEAAMNIAAEFCPDVVITDVVMPGMNGIQLVRKLREINGRVKVIMISGYSDVEYLKSALQNNAIDYIFKPIDVNELEGVLNKAVEACRDEKAEAEQKAMLTRKLNESFPLLRDKFLANLVTGEYGDRRYLKERMDFLGLDIPGNGFLVMCFHIDNSGLYAEENKNQFEKSINSILIMECIEKSFEKAKVWIPEAVFFSRLENEIAGILGLTDTGKNEAWNVKDNLSDLCAEIQRTLMLETGKVFTISFSNIIDDIIDIPIAYSQCQAALNQRFFLGRGHIIFYSDICKENNCSYAFPKNIEKELISSIYSGDVQNLSANIDMLVSNAFDNPVSINEFLHNVKLEILSFIIRMIRELDIAVEEKFYIEQFNWNELLALQNAEDIGKWLKKRLESLCSYSLQVKNSKSVILVDKVKEIINTRYKEPINLKTVAYELRTSPNYLSAIFKSTVGSNFTDYLTKRRISEAKELLRDPSAKVHEVCSRVGYDDQNYFAKVFKKYYGVNPSQFVEMERRNEKTDKSVFKV